MSRPKRFWIVPALLAAVCWSAASAAKHIAAQEATQSVVVDRDSSIADGPRLDAPNRPERSAEAQSEANAEGPPEDARARKTRDFDRQLDQQREREEEQRAYQNRQRRNGNQGDLRARPGERNSRTSADRVGTRSASRSSRDIAREENQSRRPASQTREDRRDVRQDSRDYREDTRDLREDYRVERRSTVRDDRFDDRRELQQRRDSLRDYREDQRDEFSDQRDDRRYQRRDERLDERRSEYRDEVHRDDRNDYSDHYFRDGYEYRGSDYDREVYRDREYGDGDYRERTYQEDEYGSRRADDRARPLRLRDRIRQRLDEAAENPEEFRQRIDTVINRVEQLGIEFGPRTDIRADARATFGPGTSRDRALGVNLDTNTPGRVRVTTVQPGSRAERAGIEAGDEILLVDGRRVSSRDLLVRYLNEVEAVDEVEITVHRDGENLTLYADFSQRPIDRREVEETTTPRVEIDVNR